MLLPSEKLRSVECTLMARWRRSTAVLMKMMMLVSLLDSRKRLIFTHVATGD